MKKHIISIISLIIIAILFFSPPINSKQINENYKKIENNFKNIKNIQDADLINADNLLSMKKSSLVSITGYFQSDASYGNIKSYYLKELKNEGWEFVGEEKDKDSKVLEFKKDEMNLGLFYFLPNQREDYKRTFDISIDIYF